MKPGLSLKVSQQLQLTPQLQQSIRLLQLSSLELAQEVAQLLQDNPFIEQAEQEEDGQGEAAPSPTSTEAPLDAEDWGQPPEPADLSAPLDWQTGAEAADFAPSDTYTPEAWESLPASVADGLSPHEQALAQAVQPPSLSVHLQRQALHMRLSASEQLALYFLIENLDLDGYLHDELPELVPAFAQFWGEQLAPEPAPTPENAMDSLRLALGWLHSMEPIGVGARNWSECLRLQLHHAPPPASFTVQEAAELRPMALRLCQQPLEWLARKDMRRLMPACQASEAQLRQALQWLAQLEPRPGRAFAPVQQYAMRPDIIVRPQGRGFVAQLNPEVLPRLRVHETYASALREARPRQPDGAAADSYPALQQQVQEARWWVKSLAQRFDTILRVAQAIVQQQSGFFQHGPVAMRPLVLREIAQALELHESTISRVTNGKYMATPQGTFELKYFFGSALETDTGGSASSTAVRAVIEQLIAAEDPKKPLSDAKIAEQLQQQGIECARRTVSKYREALQIPVASLRKQL